VYQTIPAVATGVIRGKAQNSATEVTAGREPRRGNFREFVEYVDRTFGDFCREFEHFFAIS